MFTSIRNFAVKCVRASQTFGKVVSGKATAVIAGGAALLGLGASDVMAGGSTPIVVTIPASPVDFGAMATSFMIQYGTGFAVVMGVSLCIMIMWKVFSGLKRS